MPFSIVLRRGQNKKTVLPWFAKGLNWYRELSEIRNMTKLSFTIFLFCISVLSIRLNAQEHENDQSLKKATSPRVERVWHATLKQPTVFTNNLIGWFRFNHQNFKAYEGVSLFSRRIFSDAEPVFQSGLAKLDYGPQ
jgi:hypothetical protein